VKERIHPDRNQLRANRQTVLVGLLSYTIYPLIPSAAIFLGHIKEQYRLMLVIPLTYKNFHYRVLKASFCLRNGN